MSNPSAPQTAPNPSAVFFSYAHADEALRDELAKHLALLQREGIITAWHDRNISAGTERQPDIDAHLNGARIILLLVSADFIASDVHYNTEMARALERHARGEARVIPIILRACEWQHTPFGKLQALPTNALPVTSWANRDDAFNDIARGIRYAITTGALPTDTLDATAQGGPPYADIWRKLHDGTLALFLGAEASACEPAARAPSPASPPRRLPNRGELVSQLATFASFPAHEHADLPKVASYHAAISDRLDLERRLRELLSPAHYGDLHALLASIDKPLCIVTTNYDTLLEQAFRAAGKPYSLLQYATNYDTDAYGDVVLYWHDGDTAQEPQPLSPNNLPLKLSEQTLIYKIHGLLHETDAERDQLVLTEEDHLQQLSSLPHTGGIPPLLYQHLRERSLLFVGYGLSDWNLRALLAVLAGSDESPAATPAAIVGAPAQTAARPIRKKPRKRLLWAVQTQPTELEKQLWHNAQVTHFTCPVPDFTAGLRRVQR